MKRVIFFAILGFSVFSKAEISFNNCSEDKKRVITQASERALERAHDMYQDAKAYVADASRYDEETNRKLNMARKMVKCARAKLRKANWVCANFTSENIVGRTIPIIGLSAKLFDNFFYESAEFRASTLFHEMTHKCGTNDALYYYHNGVNPSYKKDLSWQGTAGFYDWWFMKGVCAPGYDC